MIFRLLCTFTALATSLPLGPSHAGYVDFTLRKAAKKPAVLANKIRYGGKVLDASLENAQYYYQVRLDIGTPPQAVDFTIDTGSSDLWVMAASNVYCTLDSSNKTGVNCSGSVFNPDNSSTFSDLKQSFSIAYGDRTFANGTMVTDTVRLVDGPAISNATFGLAKIANSSTCVFGIGFTGDEGEAHVHLNKTGVYPTYFNIPALMKQQGYIDTNAYSLWLNDVDAEEGNILFGGVDRSKFEGPLTVVPIYNNYHEYTEHPLQTRVMLNSIKADNTTLSSFNIAVLLDSGTSFSYLPPQVVDTVGKSLGFEYDDDIGYYFGSTATALTNVHEFRLNFSGAEITVPTTDLLVELTDDDGAPFTLGGKRLSILTMAAVDDSYSFILGDVFLRSMYAVFDLDHYEIAIAQSRKNATGAPDIAVIEASIPGAIQATAYASTSTNNSAFYIYPFTPLIPAPATSVSAITSSGSEPTSAAATKTITIPAVTATITVVSTTTATTTTTEQQPDYTVSWSDSGRPKPSPYWQPWGPDEPVNSDSYRSASEQPPVTLYWAA